MKKLKCIIALLLVFSVLHAAGTELYQNDEWAWKSTSALCTANGVLPPPPVSPGTAFDIEKALMKIPESRLDDDEKAMRDSILSYLNRDMIYESEYVSLDPHVRIAPEIYLQTEKLEKQWDHLYDVKDMTPFFDFGFRMKAGDWAYAFGDWTMLSPGLDDVYDKIFATNLDQKMEFQHEGMMNGGILFGNGWVNAGVIRSRQEFGYGITGNLMVGDNFSRQDYMRVNLRSDWFNYTLNVTHFDQEANLKTPNGSMAVIRPQFNNMRTFQGIHRFEFRFGDAVSFAVQEGLMINTTATFDLRLLNPFIFFHGYFNNGGNEYYDPGKTADEANNYMAFELGAVIAPHLMMNFHFLLDQLQLPGEGTGKNALPHAYAALLNVSSPWVVDDHYINGWYECVVVMPYTYLNMKKQKVDGKDQWNTNLDMIVGNKNHLQHDIGYAGYTWGADSVVNALGVSWGMPGVYECDFSFTWLMHGQYGYGYKTIVAERGPEHFTDLMLDGVGFSGAEHRFIFELDGSYTPFDWLKVEGGLGFVSILNLGTEEGKNVNDLMMKLAVSFDPTQL